MVAPQASRWSWSSRWWSTASPSRRAGCARRSRPGTWNGRAPRPASLPARDGGRGRSARTGARLPTANLRFDYAPALPPLGIYAGRVSVPERGVGPGPSRAGQHRHAADLPRRGPVPGRGPPARLRRRPVWRPCSSWSCSIGSATSVVSRRRRAGRADASGRGRRARSPGPRLNGNRPDLVRSTAIRKGMWRNAVAARQRYEERDH